MNKFEEQIRHRLTSNANDFDCIVVDMLTEIERLTSIANIRKTTIDELRTNTVRGLNMKWKLVPEEPTLEMINAGIRADGWAYERYKAMLAAAPVPEGNHKSNVVDLLKGTIAMIEELENENAILRDEVKRLK